mmetsp:Transcript_21387/g.19462  ORF Transcript_21387/g.19462 Transcript_21387/m.19462 type:complete len:113 (+) Transcript_21387:49-387(+)
MLTRVFILLLLIAIAQAFMTSSSLKTGAIANTKPQSSFELMSCRRNNKIEKRKRNRAYARKFQAKGSISRRKVVIEEKRGVVAASEEKFVSVLFKFTTDEDMPAYSGFEFSK